MNRKRIIESINEPPVADLWLKNGQLFEYNVNGWSPLINTNKLKYKLLGDIWDTMWKVGDVVYGKYDPENAPDSEHPFMGNKIWMTYEEAIEILILTSKIHSGNIKDFNVFIRSSSLRTTLPIKIDSINTDASNLTKAFYDCKNLEVICFTDKIFISNSDYCFQGCSKLKEIIGSLHFVGAPTSTTFSGLALLENVYLKGIQFNINLKDCLKLSYDSINYLIFEAVNQWPITITVHPDVYAKLTGDTSNSAAAELTSDEIDEWGLLLLEGIERNITFVSGGTV